MTGAVALGLWLLTWAPNHHDLAARVASADALELRLVPWREISEPAWPLWLAWHERPVLGAAVYISDRDWQSTHALLLTGTERLMPHLSVPRLLLAPGHFRNAKGRMKKLEALGPDSAERLLHALLGAAIDSRSRTDAAFASSLEARAARTMSEVPAAHRGVAFRSALADFGAHLFSMSHEIGRHQRRRLARGESLCAVLDHPASLFGLWRRALESGEYFGYRPTAEGGATPWRSGGRWVRTRAKLSRADKTWMLEQFGVPWGGDPAEDFRFLCADASP